MVRIRRRYPIVVALGASLRTFQRIPCVPLSSSCYISKFVNFENKKVLDFLNLFFSFPIGQIPATEDAPIRRDRKGFLARQKGATLLTRDNRIGLI